VEKPSGWSELLTEKPEKHQEKTEPIPEEKKGSI